ncbi:MAG: MotA/TolQ/ExbB proton channel family protein [Sandaracinaceae bacterium]|jgi:biopolymer transport protein ExbB/TolQ|nr:MotA/TolQ/ExbB proton channel family protein [Sandaracinaceae bacterium]MBP7681016.1 MotA/TolQ/ExbB proton channel family protein [Deltaproteobacteria bacterium]MBK6813564.1 MotA/TolQ/ExbB proton channel family protein [Sandaracinaceae bacterium]MBK7778900.1 MotA/TolQ/ExbB proton channel family protein [Sandaracinaceae bacterium]MBK8410997.1 MotA/TolQ/ExbB proton channel family protein [Sandaracinaceae bacterium]
MEGAPFSFINIAVLALVLAIVAERFVFILSKYRVNATEFMAQVRKLVQAGNIDRAIKLCEAAPLPLLQVIKAGLTQVNRGEDAVIANMEEKLAEVLPALEKRIASLWTFANLATLIGLLGTIRGLIRAFAAVGTIDDPSQKTAMLSAGISEAMWNTFLGLLIAVIAMFFHLILNGMAKRQKHEMEKATMKLENLLTLKRQG